MNMITIRRERRTDQAARERLLDAAYGPVRFSKPSHKLREGRDPADGLSFVAVEDGRVVGTVRLWPVTAGAGREALLLGPLAVDPAYRNRGIGSALMRRAMQDAQRGHQAVLLVGDACYYGRFGFSAEKTGRAVAARPVRTAPAARLRVRRRRAGRRPRLDPRAATPGVQARAAGRRGDPTQGRASGRLTLTKSWTPREILAASYSVRRS